MISGNTNDNDEAVCVWAYLQGQRWDSIKEILYVSLWRRIFKKRIILCKASVFLFWAISFQGFFFLNFPVHSHKAGQFFVYYTLIIRMLISENMWLK